MRLIVLIWLALTATALAQPPEPLPEPDLVMETRAIGCAPCDADLRNMIPEALKLGLKVLIVPVTDGVTPRYRYMRKTDSMRVRHEGMLSLDRLREIRKR